VSGSRKVVVLGMMTKIPVAGVVWQTAHYLLGLRRLGLDPYYVEAHARTPSMLMARAEQDGSLLAAAFIDRVMRRFDLGDRWAYQALHADGRCYGLSERRLLDLYAEAELILNLHGGTAPRPEHSRTGRLVYVETDPVQLQVELADGVPETIEFLEQHCAFFTFGENWGAADCGLPRTSRFDFRPTRQPVCLDLWPTAELAAEPAFTTVGNWRQIWRDVTFEGRTYGWSKHTEFAPYLDLPARTGERFELTLSGYDEADRSMLEANGWRVRDALDLSLDLDAYRSYVSRSLGEFTVAKEQNVALRSGWFSDRSATYLAAGRPVVTQETGFSAVLPTGSGLYPFSTPDEAAAAIERICADPAAASRGARQVAAESFAAETVLGEMLAALGVRTGPVRPATNALGGELPLTPLSRRPLKLRPEAAVRIAHAPIPFTAAAAASQEPRASVVVVTCEGYELTRLCLESVLESTEAPGYELIVVDNGSCDTTRSYLLTLERRLKHVRALLNAENRGFPAACNQGLAAARGEILVLLNNDAIVAPGWLVRLARHLDSGDADLVGPATNRIGNEAEVEVRYETYGEFLEAAAQRAERHDGERFELPMPAMFCLAMRREAYERIGPLDEGFGLGTLEDDDYALRARRAGLRCAGAEDVLVHHFGEGSFGHLYADGSHSALLERNRRRFEEKWGEPWQPYERRPGEEYEAVLTRVRSLVSERTPPGSAVVVASRGDEELIGFDGRVGLHFPQSPEGGYAGHHPADSDEAIAQLEELRSRGASHFVIPKTSLWWLEHYRELGAHLNERYREVVCDDDCVVFALEGES
jgi:GT2 family glycosyltransferase